MREMRTLNQARVAAGLHPVDAKTRSEFGEWFIPQPATTRLGRWRQQRRRKANARQMVRTGVLSQEEAANWLRECAGR